MDIMQKVTAELIAWNDKVAKGYQMTAIEKAYYEGLRKQYAAMLDAL